MLSVEEYVPDTGEITGASALLILIVYFALTILPGIPFLLIYLALTVVVPEEDRLMGLL